MNSHYVDIKADNGKQFQAYLATPKITNGHGIVLLQEIFGVNDYIRGVADHYAAAGYTVVAPDLYWRLEPGIELGYDEPDLKRAYAYRNQFDVAAAVRDIDATVKRVRTLDNVGNVGALGFCLGGKLAYLAAAHCSVDLAVAYYPVGVESDIDLAPGISCPLMLHIAELDRLCPPAAQAIIQKAFANRTDVDVHLYAGVGHAFSAPARPSYNTPASELALKRSMQKFNSVLTIS